MLFTEHYSDIKWLVILFHFSSPSRGVGVIGLYDVRSFEVTS